MTRPSIPSISVRLTRMNLLVSGSVLLMALFAILSYDLFSFRQNLIHDLGAEAQIVGENTVSALEFNDQQSATATLAGLERSPDVIFAVVTTNDQRQFAHYGNTQTQVISHSLASNEVDRVWPTGIDVFVAHRIVFQGKSVGVLYISARLTEMGHRARQYALIAGVILLFCMAAALIISAVSRRLIAQPIIALADTALVVSQERDYSVRARIRADSSEIAILVEAFNTMLKQIQERDAALNEARNDLEARVEQRTAELQAANRELEAFSYTVAHDLRGPLDAISNIGYLLAKDGGTEQDTVRPMLDMFRVSTANMASLIDDLLNFSRASSAQLRSDPVSLTAIAREIAAELTASEPGRKVQFVINDLPEVQTDIGLVRIVLANLLRNSWKYTSHHGEACIEFGARQSLAKDQTGNKLVYFVRDDGAGFDPRLTDQLFQPFQRLHSKGEFPGTGIGLATVRRILDRQGGSIWGEGAIEKGATFYFTLNASGDATKSAVQ